MSNHVYSQWFAGSFAWTKRELRIMTAEDLTYLTAFGNCIMAEKSRLDSELADRAKSDFISVVSHELRSPLHGFVFDSLSNMNYKADLPIQCISQCRSSSRYFDW